MSFILSALFAAGGASTLILEILGVRLLAPFFGSTIFVWSSLIVTTLGGLALGYRWGGAASKKEVGLVRMLFLCFFINGILFLLIPSLIKLFAPLFDGLGLRFGPLITALVVFGPTFFIEGIAAPIGVRIMAANNNESGVAAGNIYFISTVGSLIGALLAGFYLIPILPLHAIFQGLGLILIVLSLWYRETQGRAEKMNLLWCIVIALGATVISIESPPPARAAWFSVLEQKDTFYSTLRVVEYGDARCLLSGLAIHGCIDSKTLLAKDGPLEDRVLAPLFPALHNKQVLVVGGGTGSLISGLPEDTSATLLELDPATIELGRKYFDAQKIDRATIVIDDVRHGIASLARERKSYDLIIIDVFSEISLPPHVFTTESMQSFKKILSPGGVIVVNGGIMPERPKENDPYVSSLAKTAHTAFQNVGAWWGNDPQSSNLIVLFSDSSLPRIDLPELHEGVSGMVLADDFNPLEYYYIDQGLGIINIMKPLLSKSFVE